MRRLAFALALLASPLVAADTYSIAYVRVPRTGSVKPDFSEVRPVGTVDSAADLVLWTPGGAEKVLVDCDSTCSVADPSVSLDGKSIYYALVHDPAVRNTGVNAGEAPRNGVSIHRVAVAGGAPVEIVPVGSYELANPTDRVPSYKPMHMSPQELPGGKLAFASNRFGHRPPKGTTFPTMQIFVRFPTGELEPVAPMSIASALHPTLLKDGQLMFSSAEDQGLRDPRQWGLWAINPDGRNWKPVLSAFINPLAPHFQTQLTDGTILVTNYYNQNNFGFGQILAIPPPPATGPAFHSAVVADRPKVPQETTGGYSFAFAPKGIYTIAPWTTPHDRGAPCPAGQATCAAADRVGKLTHPSAAPANKYLLAYSKGPVNTQSRPTNQPWPDAGVYRAAGVLNAPAALELIVNKPEFNEYQPVAVVSWQDKYGAPPVDLPWLPQGVLHPALPPGTPYGIVATSSLCHRESFPGIGVAAYGGLDPYNTAQNGASENWDTQGGDVRLFEDSEISALRINVLEPALDNDPPSLRPDNTNAPNERMRFLGDLPRLADCSVPQGVIPADQPFKFQLIDANKQVIVDGPTWHQVRPGEARYDCGGCHAHSKEPIAYETTQGFQAPLVYLTGPTRSPTWLKDIAPLVDRIEGKVLGVALGDLASDAAYKCIAEDQAGTCRPSKLSTGQWRQINASAYARPYSPDRSFLSWAAHGARSDGWTDDTFPDTGNTADFNFDPVTWVWSLTPVERETIDLWIGVGLPYGGPAWDRDTARPALNVAEPVPGANAKLPRLLYGAADANSGLAAVSVVASWPVRGRAAGEELSGLAVEAAPALNRQTRAVGHPLAGVWEIDLVEESCPNPGGCVQQSPPITAGVVVVAAKDGHGNVRRIERRFQLAAVAATATPAPTTAPTVPLPPTPQRTATPQATPTPTPECYRGHSSELRVDLTKVPCK